ncbi:Coumaroyl-CoA:anthocyanidin 3-O-glucoside-6''-O-coumaroyltransferase 2 [Forsythia ovata]|uniref:Coumaroyl-CoA:anthocyanidin 3-O-glucoside-6''-O-coumaroyltransferase 2 n=1 Tax=Forsythia ovata TaxID=205694 RepID=A0ABD1S824_9LAMI
MATQLERCEILPPPAEVTELSLPLTFLDIPWLYSHPIQRLLFYEFPCSKPYFLETIVPNLKESLSLTLKHYIPLASNVLYPSSNEKPVFRYVVGDSVSLTIAESSDDFNNLTANYARDADQFYPFVPQLPPPKEEAEYKTFRVLCLQVTLFPNRGVCIGITNHHTIGDASSIVGFIKAWASISKLGGDSQLIEAKFLPLFDRFVIKDPCGIADVYLSQIKNFKLLSSSLHLPTNKVRATYILHQADMKKLKDSVSAQKPDLVQPSSFVVTTAYVWTCLVKSGPASGEEVDADEPEYFSFAVDCRARMNPPVPANYFGNCLGGVIIKRKHQELMEKEGFFIAAEAIAEIIRTKVNKKDEMMKGAENWLVYFAELVGKRVLSVAGSPKFDLYEADYGWGRPKKLEAVSIDGDDSISLCKSRDSEGGLEIGLSLTKNKMDAFSAIFASGLGILSKEVVYSK